VLKMILRKPNNKNESFKNIVLRKSRKEIDNYEKQIDDHIKTFKSGMQGYSKEKYFFKSNMPLNKMKNLKSIDASMKGIIDNMYALAKIPKKLYDQPTTQTTTQNIIAKYAPFLLKKRRESSSEMYRKYLNNMKLTEVEENTKICMHMEDTGTDDDVRALHEAIFSKSSASTELYDYFTYSSEGSESVSIPNDAFQKIKNHLEQIKKEKNEIEESTDSSDKSSSITSDIIDKDIEYLNEFENQLGKIESNLNQTKTNLDNIEEQTKEKMLKESES
jgi:hypothetical protein